MPLCICWILSLWQNGSRVKFSPMNSVWKHTISSCVRDALGVHTATAFLNLILIFPIPVSISWFLWSNFSLTLVHSQNTGVWKGLQRVCFRKQNANSIFCSVLCFFKVMWLSPKQFLVRYGIQSHFSPWCYFLFFPCIMFQICCISSLNPFVTLWKSMKG